MMQKMTGGCGTGMMVVGGLAMFLGQGGEAAHPPRQRPEVRRLQPGEIGHGGQGPHPAFYPIRPFLRPRPHRSPVT